MEERAEGAAEGELNAIVGETDQTIRYQGQRMSVRTKWTQCVKPGGTAGMFPVPA